MKAVDPVPDTDLWWKYSDRVIQSKFAQLNHQRQYVVAESHSSRYTSGTTSILNLSSQNTQGNFQILWRVTLSEAMTALAIEVNKLFDRWHIQHLRDTRRLGNV